MGCHGVGAANQRWMHVWKSEFGGWKMKMEDDSIRLWLLSRDIVNGDVNTQQSSDFVRLGSTLRNDNIKSR